MDLFSTSQTSSSFRPLADRLRPVTLETFVGQTHLVGEGKILSRLIETKQLVSMIFWGPPGTGKTTLARIVASKLDAEFVAISAVTSGVKDLRQVIDQAQYHQKALDKKTILFIDEIHRFNKSQQDALLHAVEDGTLMLIGATTENPSFEVNAPLLSRCRVLVLRSLSEEDLERVLDQALVSDAMFKEHPVTIPDETKSLLIRLSQGDARVLLNMLELCVQFLAEGNRELTPDIVQLAVQKRIPRYDKKGEGHYDTISAFIKSVRGSDPDGAVYWMARMLDAGEDPLFIARRMVILASEDVGNADPQGLVLANAAFQAVHAVGMPEARIILAQTATYLASAEKSNAAYLAIDTALKDARETSVEPVPLHIRNAPTGLMKDLGYGDGYRYAHDFEGGFVEQEYLPDALKGRIYYHPKTIGREVQLRERLNRLWKKRRGEQG